MIEIGHVCELYRYPVKSMASVVLDSALLGWYGLEGDRRFAFRRMNDNNGFPWLTASRLPRLIRYQPFGQEAGAKEPLPTMVRTPEGRKVPLRSEELRAEIATPFGSPVELMNLKHGIFDAATVSLIAAATISGMQPYTESILDSRRFRPNIVFDTNEKQPFGENCRVGGTVIFGDVLSSAAIKITIPDERCMMINLDPDSAKQDVTVMKAVVRLNQNNAGVYGTVMREGAIAVGQRVSLLIN
jgi:uncharacterized protein YcbX